MAWRLLFNLKSLLPTIKRVEVANLLGPETDHGFAKSYDGTAIFWKLYGPHPSETKKRPMLFCYGLACSMNQWRAQIEKYKEDTPCILLDYRGHHNSSFPDNDKHMNFSSLAKDAVAVLDALKIEGPVHVWGHSMGCNVSLELAVAYPELCQSLILCAGSAENPFGRMFGSDLLQKFISPILETFPNKKEYFFSLWQILLSNPEITKFVVQFSGFNRNAVNSEDIDTYINAVSSVSPKSFFPLLLELQRGGTINILPQVKAPTLVISGAADMVTPPDIQERLAEHIPHAEYCSVPMGSHNVQLEFGDYISLKVQDFLNRKNVF